MHDGISQTLFSISLGMELCKKQVRKDVPGALRTLGDLQQQLTGSAAELRRLIYDLRPMKLKELGLVGSVQTWVREATRGTDVKGSAEVIGKACNLEPAQEACLYQVAKEAVSNAVRHSGGNRVFVRIEYRDNSVALSISDDGDGFAAGWKAPSIIGTGAGLRNMRERMAAAGGSLTVNSTPGEGSVVRAEIPIGAE